MEYVWKPASEYPELDDELFPLISADPYDVYAQDGPDSEVIVVCTDAAGEPLAFCRLKKPSLPQVVGQQP